MNRIKLSLIVTLLTLILTIPARAEQNSTNAVPKYPIHGSTCATAVRFGADPRTGLEPKLHQHTWLGVGVRGNWSNIDFSMSVAVLNFQAWSVSLPIKQDSK